MSHLWDYTGDCVNILCPNNFYFFLKYFMTQRDGMEGEERGGGIPSLPSWLIHIVVWQKATQHCKPIFLQLKNKFKNILFSLLFAVPLGFVGNSSSTRGLRTPAPCSKMSSPNHWTTRELPIQQLFPPPKGFSVHCWSSSESIIPLVVTNALILVSFFVLLKQCRFSTETSCSLLFSWSLFVAGLLLAWSIYLSVLFPVLIDFPSSGSELLGKTGQESLYSSVCGEDIKLKWE